MPVRWLEVPRQVPEAHRSALENSRKLRSPELPTQFGFAAWRFSIIYSCRLSSRLADGLPLSRDGTKE